LVSSYLLGFSTSLDFFACPYAPCLHTMSVPNSVQLKMYHRVKGRQEFIAAEKDITAAFMEESDSIAPEVLQTFLEGTHVFIIAQYVYSKLNAAKIDRATANLDMDDNMIYSAAPLEDYLVFVGVQVDNPTAGMTLQEALNTMTFVYKVPDGDELVAPASAAPHAAGSSSSAINLIDEDPPKSSNKKRELEDIIAKAVPSYASSVRSDASVPATTHPSVVGSPVVGGKAKATNLQATNLQILGNPHKRVCISDSDIFSDILRQEIVETLKKSPRPLLQEVAGRMEVNKYQNKNELANNIAEETFKLAVKKFNKLNNGRA
jgi:hypothetical protein